MTKPIPAAESFSDRLRRAEALIRANNAARDTKIKERASVTTLPVEPSVFNDPLFDPPLPPDVVRLDDIAPLPVETNKEKVDWSSEKPVPVVTFDRPRPPTPPVVPVVPTLEAYLPPVTEIVPVQENSAPQRQGRLIEDNLTQTVETDSSIKTVAKELFNRTNIDLKTEVSHDEINNITKLRLLQVKYGVENIDVLVHSFLGLRVSKDRKSRGEFVNIVQTENRNTQGGGFLSKLSGAFGGNNNAT